MPPVQIGHLTKYGNSMKTLKAILFIVTSISALIGAAKYSGWSAMGLLIYVILGIFFVVSAFYLYKRMYSDDE